MQCGIRGAVTLLFVLIIDTDRDFDSSVSDMMLLHIGVIVMLTLVVNATSIHWTVHFFDLNRSSTACKLFFLHAMHELEEHSNHAIRGMKHEDWAQDVDWERLNTYMPILKEHMAHKMSLKVGKESLEAHTMVHLDKVGKYLGKKGISEMGQGEHDLLVEARHIFLNLVKNKYEQRIESHVLVAHASMDVLEESLKVAQDNIETNSLNDWEQVLKYARLPHWRFVVSNYLTCGGSTELVFKHYLLHGRISFAVELATHFIEGHEAAQRDLPHMIGEHLDKHELLEAAVKQVLQESIEETKKAHCFVEEIRQSFKSVLISVRTNLAIENYISEMRHHAEHLGHEGKIEEKDEIAIFEGLQVLQAKLWRDSHRPVSICEGSGAALLSHPLLHDCDDNVKQMFMSKVHETVYDDQVSVLNENELSDFIFVLSSGKCIVENAKGEVDLLFPGAVIGLYSGLTGTPSPVTTTSVGRSVLHRISCSDLLHIAAIDADHGKSNFKNTLFIQVAVHMILGTRCYPNGQKMPAALVHRLLTIAKVQLSEAYSFNFQPSFEKYETAISVVLKRFDSGAPHSASSKILMSARSMRLPSVSIDSSRDGIDDINDIVHWDARTSNKTIVVPPQHVLVHFPNTMLKVDAADGTAVLSVNVKPKKLKKQIDELKTQHQSKSGVEILKQSLNSKAPESSMQLAQSFGSSYTDSNSNSKSNAKADQVLLTEGLLEQSAEV